MKKHQAILSLLLLALALLPMASFAQQSPDSILTRPDPKQYGRPFSKVPDRRDVIIYQVNMRAFSKEGNFKGVIDRLDSIKALGANLIYLLPIYPVGVLHSSNSPYCVQNYTAINNEFGTLKDLRTLVDGAHKRNMAVMLDWVANHTSYDNPWIHNKSWYLLDTAGKIMSPPGFHWPDVAQLNYKNPDMRLAMIKSMKYWVLTANVDGFRCDYADGPPGDFWKQAIDSLRNIRGHKLIMLAEGTRKDLFPDGFDYTFGFRFYGNLKQIYRKNRSVRSIDTINTDEYRFATPGQQMVRYLTNHDVNSTDGTPLQLFGGKDGSLAAFIVVAYMDGVPFIYNGQEVGMATRLIFPFTKTKVDWTPNPEITNEYKKILAFRNKSMAIRRGDLASYSSNDVCVFTKTAGNEKVLVLSNLRNTSSMYLTPPQLLNTAWVDAFTGAKYQVGQMVNLAPYTYLVLKR